MALGVPGYSIMQASLLFKSNHCYALWKWFATIWISASYLWKYHFRKIQNESRWNSYYKLWPHYASRNQTYKTLCVEIPSKVFVRKALHSQNERLNFFIFVEFENCLWFYREWESFLTVLSIPSYNFFVFFIFHSKFYSLYLPLALSIPFKCS